MRIALLGDIGFYGKFDITKNTSVKEHFAEVATYLAGFDLVIGNFEAPFSVNSKPFGHKSAYIKTDPANVELLNFLNIGIVNLANNHTYDYGEEGYELTKEILSENGIKYFGIEDKTEFVEYTNNKIALHGYCCYSTNPVGVFENKKYGINKLEVEHVESKMKEYHEAGYLNIVSIHAGEEHVNYPNFNHILVARQLAKISPYIHYGHHPHVLQGIEEVDESLIAYSLGNFCFDDIYTSKSSEPLIKQNRNNNTSVILSLQIENSKLVQFETVGIYAASDKLELNHTLAVENIKQYSKGLLMAPDEYISKRKNILDEYLKKRKNKRDFQWYMKRLNIGTALMLAAGKRNRRLFEKYVLSQLKK